MTDRALIVARMAHGSAARISRLFGESDSTVLPLALGIRQRQLFSYGPLYFHYVEFSGDRHAALQRAARRADFRRLSEELSEFVRPYDPATWRSPADAMATQFYTWTAEETP